MNMERIMLSGQSVSLVERCGKDQLSLSLLCDGRLVAGIVMSVDSARELAAVLLNFAEDVESETGGQLRLMGGQPK